MRITCYVSPKNCPSSSTFNDLRFDQLTCKEKLTWDIKFIWTERDSNSKSSYVEFYIKK